VTHYCVANMPGAVPVTSTYALTNATLPYVLHLADAGVARAARENPGLAPGVNVAQGKVTYRPVAEATGLPYVELFDVLGEGAVA
jgi:alanine dehydrogenase